MKWLLRRIRSQHNCIAERVHVLLCYMGAGTSESPSNGEDKEEYEAPRNSFIPIRFGLCKSFEC